jgi:hypothetical protein
MEGGLHLTRVASVLHCRVRYFDPERRRAGIPEDVAALVEAMSDDSLTVTLVNTSQVAERVVLLQAGAYAEHQLVSASAGGGPERPVRDSSLEVRLGPGCGTRLKLAMKRFANQPTLAAPWDR